MLRLYEKSCISTPPTQSVKEEWTLKEQFPQRPFFVVSILEGTMEDKINGHHILEAYESQFFCHLQLRSIKWSNVSPILCTYIIYRDAESFFKSSTVTYFTKKIFAETLVN